MGDLLEAFSSRAVAAVAAHFGNCFAIPELLWRPTAIPLPRARLAEAQLTITSAAPHSFGSSSKLLTIPPFALVRRPPRFPIRRTGVRFARQQLGRRGVVVLQNGTAENHVPFQKSHKTNGHNDCAVVPFSQPLGRMNGSGELHEASDWTDRSPALGPPGDSLDDFT